VNEFSSFVDPKECLSPPHLRMEADSVSETLCSFEYRMIEEIQKPSNSECVARFLLRTVRLLLISICPFRQWAVEVVQRGDGRKIGYGRQVFVNNCGKCRDYSYILCGFNVSL
jgi:hypothetical protein